MKRSEPVLYFLAGLLASGVVYFGGVKFLALQAAKKPQMAEQGFKRFPQNSLPALAPKARIVLDSGLLIRVHAAFGPEWELNTKAPSWMALFEKGDGKSDYSQILEVTQDSILKNDFNLGELNLGRQYLLQGSLYQCKTGDHGVCSLKSYSYELEPSLPVNGGLERRVVELN